MDHTHGVIDRILITTPLAFRLTLTEIEGAKEKLETDVDEDFTECFENISDTSLQLRFHFSDKVQQLLRVDTA